MRNSVGNMTDLPLSRVMMKDLVFQAAAFLG